MRTNENLYRTFLQSIKHLLTTLALDNARKQLHTHVHPVQELLDGLQMLFGENLRRSHHAGLEAVIHGDEHSHERHERLA